MGRSHLEAGPCSCLRCDEANGVLVHRRSPRACARLCGQDVPKQVSPQMAPQSRAHACRWLPQPAVGRWAGVSSCVRKCGFRTHHDTMSAGGGQGKRGRAGGESRERRPWAGCSGSCSGAGSSLRWRRCSRPESSPGPSCPPCSQRLLAAWLESWGNRALWSPRGCCGHGRAGGRAQPGGVDLTLVPGLCIWSFLGRRECLREEEEVPSEPRETLGGGGRAGSITAPRPGEGP